jgi:hypothetical protein
MTKGALNLREAVGTVLREYQSNNLALANFTTPYLQYSGKNYHFVDEISRRIRIHVYKKVFYPVEKGTRRSCLLFDEEKKHRSRITRQCPFKR